LSWFHGAALLTQTPSAATRSELQAMGLGRAVVWGRGVDTRRFVPALRSEPRRRELGAVDRPIVLHVGRLAVEKDTATLVAGFQAARSRLGEGALFCVAGDGPEARTVREALPFARHLGFLPRPRLAELYADSDLFVFPSPTETCGLVALEAMASGLPVIGAAAGGLRENVMHGITGILVQPGDGDAFADAIGALVTDESLRRAMGQGARAFATARDWERELDRLEVLYQKARETATAAPAPTNWPTRTSVT
jgi:phosphatidylinositol alpha 1,6-mannosyltransferase